MANTKQILHFVCHGKEYKVIEHSTGNNRFWIYCFYYTIDENRHFKKHRKLMVKYADMISCLYWFIENRINYD